MKYSLERSREDLCFLKQVSEKKDKPLLNCHIFGILALVEMCLKNEKCAVLLIAEGEHFA